MASVDLDIADIRKDIDVLERELETLEAQRAELTKELHELDEETADFDDEPRSRHLDEDDVPLVQHSHFDDSIARFFSEQQPEEPKHRSELSYSILSRTDHAVQIKENVLLENIFRFHGITAFPINKHLFSDDDELLGLRFDVFSHHHNKFLTPHYIILRKVHPSDKTEAADLQWLVYRHTVPVYVPISNYTHHLATENILEFAKSIRNHLVHIQYKHDKLDKLTLITHQHIGGTSTDAVISRLDKDLQANQVAIYIPHHDTTHIVHLSCSDDTIDSCSITLASDHLNDIVHTESLLRGTTFANLIKQFKPVLRKLVAL